MSTIKVDTIKNTSNVEVYTAKAWVNFDGTQTAASMIRGSGNVSSITDNGTGDYTINFATAMPDTNYAVAGISNWQGTNRGSLIGINELRTLTVSNCPVTTQAPSNYAVVDFTVVTLSFFR